MAQVISLLVQELPGANRERLLLQAVQNSNYEMLNCLRDNQVNFQVRDDNYANALIAKAVINNDLPIFEFLLAQKIESCLVRETIFGLVRQGLSFESFYLFTEKLLACDSQLDINQVVPIDYFQTLMQHFSVEQIAQCLELLVKYGYQVDWSQLMINAFHTIKPEFIEWVLQQGADPNFNEQEIFKLIIYWGPRENSKNFAQYLTMLDLLFAYGAASNLPNSELLNSINQEFDPYNFEDFNNYDEEKAQVLRTFLHQYVVEHAHLLTKPAH